MNLLPRHSLAPPTDRPVPPRRSRLLPRLPTLDRVPPLCQRAHDWLPDSTRSARLRSQGAHMLMDSQAPRTQESTQPFGASVVSYLSSSCSMSPLSIASATSRSASALTSRSRWASQDSARSMPSFIWASVGGLAYMPAAISAVASFAVSSLIVLVSFRQVRHHSAGVVLSTVRAVIGGLL